MTKSKAPPLTLRNPETIRHEVIHQEAMHQEADDLSAPSIPVRDDEFFSEGQNQTMYDRYPASQEMHYQVA
jgi:hypothetical protein